MYFLLIQAQILFCFFIVYLIIYFVLCTNYKYQEIFILVLTAFYDNSRTIWQDYWR
jgi:hypothetical protein